jgi:1-acyl-sn-glycerol-3-phosphate acyltransferase
MQFTARNLHRHVAPRLSQERRPDACTMRSPHPSPDSRLEAVRAVVDATWRELHAGADGVPTIAAASVLDRDLGFDSLGRMELLLRIEHAFGVHLPEDTLQGAETVADLCDAVRRAGAAPALSTFDTRTAPPLAASEAAPAAGSPLDADTLLAAFDWHLNAHPDRVQVTVLADDAEVPLSYRALDASARTLAAGLRRAGVQPRQCVALMLPTSTDYFGVFLAILRVGAIPVPIYPPARASQLEDHVLRHAGILGNAQAVMLVTVPEAMTVARLLRSRVPALHQVATPAQLSSASARDFTPLPSRADEIAFIQYTSGSTGNPKGVALTHANLMANIRTMAATVQATPRDVFVSWLPLYHDMGLIGAWLGGMVVGYAVVVMSPLAFLARPVRWLQAMHRYRGTLSAAPNFAYELCLKRIDDADLAGIDLSAWRLAFNGAEAVSPDTVLRFHERFAAQGFKRETMAPVYGLAECCVGLLFPPLGRAPLIDRVQREPLAREGRAVPARDDDAAALRFVACGAPLPGHAVRLLDTRGAEVGERSEGRLEFKGPSATQGYFRNPAQTEQLIGADGWLDTGDRAYRAGGDLYITGRVKDIVIRGGRNLYPQEIEEAIGAVNGVRKGCVAVFGSADAASGTERLVVLAEVRPGSAQAPLREAVAQAVIAAIGEPADEIVLAPPHTVLKTSSGKVRRSACRAWYESGAVGRAQPTARRQALRLAWGALRPRLAGLAFGVNTHLWFGLLTPLVWLLTLLLPRPAWAWALGHRAARGLLRLAGVPFTVQGLDRLPAGPCVLVCNHGSYADGMLLVAALPRPFVFVAKRELRAQPIAGWYLHRLGAEFVERADVARSVADAERLAAIVQQGRCLLVFPEGTFVDRPGLLPFHLGAFLAAARAGAPVVPVALSGSRRLLPGGSGWPRRARVLVQLGEPIRPASDAPNVFAAGVRLRDAARGAIARALAATPDGDVS